MEIERLKTESIELNTGQIDGLPSNPRQWTKADRDRLARSLKETPELFDARPLITVRHGDKYVILGGNLRYSAAFHLGYKEMPAFVLPEDMPVEKMREIVLKDNGEFGEWNYSLLSQDWKEYDFAELGIELPEEDAFFEKNKEIMPGDFSENITLKLRYDPEDAARVKEFLGKDRRGRLLKLLGYEDNED